jgi:hypothetical protein
MDGHANRNLLKKRPNVINFSTHSYFITPPTMGKNLNDVASTQLSGMGVGGASRSFSKSMTKANVF